MAMSLTGCKRFPGQSQDFADRPGRIVVRAALSRRIPDGSTWGGNGVLPPGDDTVASGPERLDLPPEAGLDRSEPDATRTVPHQDPPRPPPVPPVHGPAEPIRSDRIGPGHRPPDPGRPPVGPAMTRSGGTFGMIGRADTIAWPNTPSGRERRHKRGLLETRGSQAAARRVHESRHRVSRRPGTVLIWSCSREQEQEGDHRGPGHGRHHPVPEGGGLPEPHRHRAPTRTTTVRMTSCGTGSETATPSSSSASGNAQQPRSAHAGELVVSPPWHGHLAPCYTRCPA